MTIKIKQLPECERPYEKLEIYGEKMLSNAELLAIIIKSGTKENTSIELANKVLNLIEFSNYRKHKSNCINENFSNAKFLYNPGAVLVINNAASIAIVPLPHIGSIMV